MVASIKSSRLRQTFAPPPCQIQPRCTASLGVASTVVQLAPPSYVVATYRCHTPANAEPCSPPVVVVPRNATAARPPSPATAAGNAVLLMLNTAPTSYEVVQVRP